MPRDIPVGNGDLLVTFDPSYRVRDIYYPRVGRHNHTDGHVQRFGVWVDGEFAWIEDEGWAREIRYQPDTMVTDIRLVHEEFELEVTCSDCVDFHEPVYFRLSRVRDLKGKTRDVRLFFHWDLSINGTPVGDTANYDPTTSGVVLYKDDSYFLVNAADQHKTGIDHWAIGAKRIGDHEGTWRDAEDGQLGRNAISQGSVDATVGFNLQVPAYGQASVTSWLACGHSYDEVRKLNEHINFKGAERMIGRTGSYWHLWCRKEPLDTAPLPEPIRDMYFRSQLIMRSQIDNGGAIIAANDSDITHFAGDHYSYCWMRDGALVTQALILSGQSELSRNFFRFAADCIEEPGYFLHKYTPEGNLASSWHPWMIEGQRVLPIQQDETALVTWALRLHFDLYRDVEFIKPLYSPLIVRPAEWMLEYRDHHGLPLQSWDLWEERRGVHLFTVAATIGALHAAAGFAEDFGERDRATIFREGAERMTGAMRRHFWHDEKKCFARMLVPLEDGTYRMDMTRDSANHGVWAFGCLEPDDPMVVADMTSVRERLWVQTDTGGCARYERDYYHQIETEDTDSVAGNPWVICTLWQAHWTIERAKSVEELKTALPIMQWCVDRALPSGVLGEQFNPDTGEPISVSPLTWSHSTFVVCCVRYLRRLAELTEQARKTSTTRA